MENNNYYPEYPEQITLILRPKYNKIIRDKAKQLNIPINQLLNKIIIEYIEKENEHE